MTSPKAPPLVQVNTRIYSADVRILKARARAQGASWQFLLREALRIGVEATALPIPKPDRGDDK